MLAHGLYDDGRCWAPLANAFADRFDVVTYDARGHGRSDKPPDGYAVDDRIADLRGLIDGLGIHLGNNQWNAGIHSPETTFIHNNGTSIDCPGGEFC